MSYNTDLQSNNTELAEILETINSLPEAGSGGDYDEGYNAGLAEGKQAEYDRFWNALQNNGASMDYTYAFSGAIWDDDCYNPKYPIKATSCINMFRNSSITDTKVTIDLSNGTGTHVLNNCQKLVRIPLVIVNSNLVYTGWLANCKALEEVSFEGIIGQAFDVKDASKLTAKSLVSIVEHLSSTTSGKTLTVSNTAVTNAEWSTTNYASWDELIATKANWSFVKS